MSLSLDKVREMAKRHGTSKLPLSGIRSVLAVLLLSSLSCIGGAGDDHRNGAYDEATTAAPVLEQATSAAEPSVSIFPRHGDVPLVNQGDDYVYGDLMLIDGCLRVSYVDADFADRITAGLLLIWPAGFGWNDGRDVVQVVDASGEAVAEVGGVTRISGRLVWSEPSQDVWDWGDDVSSRCSGPYWVVGDEVSAGERLLPVKSDPGIHVPLLRHQSGAILAGDALLEGRLVSDSGCLRVVPDPGVERYLVLWPPGFWARVVDEEIEVMNGGGHTIAVVGDSVRLGGSGAWDAVEGGKCSGRVFHAYSVVRVR